MQIIGICSNGAPWIMYDGDGTHSSLRARMNDLCNAYITINWNPALDHQERELAVAKQFQQIANAYVEALEKAP